MTPELRQIWGNFRAYHHFNRSADTLNIMVTSNDSYFILNVAINSEQNPSSFVSIPKIAIAENY